MTGKSRLRLAARQRATFTIQALNRSHILLPLVSLFHDLNIVIEAIFMIRRQGAEKVRISVTVQMDREHARKIEGHLTNVPGVLSVSTEIGTKDVLRNSPSNEATPRSET